MSNLEIKKNLYPENSNFFKKNSKAIFGFCKKMTLFDTKRFKLWQKNQTPFQKIVPKKSILQ